MIVALAAPALAQSKSKPAAGGGTGTSDVAISYNLLHVSQSGSSSTSPVGWIFQWTRQVNDMWSAVADIAGHYAFGGDFEGSEIKLHTFQGGARYLIKTSSKAKPDAGVVLGLSHVSGISGFSENDFVITPAFGVNVPANDKWTFRIELGVPLIKSEDVWVKGIRIGVGIVKQVSK